MAHSFVTYRGIHRNLNDAKIALVVYTVIAFSRSHPTVIVSDSILRLVQSWYFVIDANGPGCIDLNLDAYLDSEENRQEYLKLLRNAHDWLLKYGNEGKAVEFGDAVANIDLQSIRFEKTLPTTQIHTAFREMISVVDAD